MPFTNTNILNKLRSDYNDKFLMSATLETDIEEYKVDLNVVFASFARIMLGEVYSSGHPEVVISKLTLTFDGELIYSMPQTEEIINGLIASWTNDGPISDEHFTTLEEHYPTV